MVGEIASNSPRDRTWHALVSHRTLTTISVFNAASAVHIKLQLFVEACKSDVSNQNDNGSAHIFIARVHLSDGKQSERHVKIIIWRHFLNSHLRMMKAKNFFLLARNLNFRLFLSTNRQPRKRASEWECGGKSVYAAIKIVIWLNGSSHLWIHQTIASLRVCVRVNEWVYSATFDVDFRQKQQQQLQAKWVCKRVSASRV